MEEMMSSDIVEHNCYVITFRPDSSCGGLLWSFFSLFPFIVVVLVLLSR